MDENEKLQLAYGLLREAGEKIPGETTLECMQIAEKIWGAFAQATKAYKDWETDRAYSSLIGEIYKNYPQYKGDIRQAHITARYLHSDGFYLGIAAPSEEDIASVERGIKAIESILQGN